MTVVSDAKTAEEFRAEVITEFVRERKQVQAELRGAKLVRDRDALKQIDGRLRSMQDLFQRIVFADIPTRAKAPAALKDGFCIEYIEADAPKKSEVFPTLEDARRWRVANAPTGQIVPVGSKASGV